MDQLASHMAKERAEAVRTAPTRPWAAFVKEHPVVFAVVFFVVGLLALRLIGGFHAPATLAPAVREWIDLGALLLANAAIAALMVALGWWRAAGFTGPRDWRSPHLLWLPALYLVTVYAIVFLQPRSGMSLDSSALSEGLSVMFLVGFAEEMLFRGLVLFPLLYAWRFKPHGVLWAVLTTSALFALAHIGNLTDQPLTDTLTQVGYTFFWGVALAGMLLRTNTLWLGIIWHGLRDAAGVVSEALDQGQSTGEASSLVSMAIDLPLLIYGLYLIRERPVRADSRVGCGSSEVSSSVRPGVRSCAGRAGGRGVRVLCGCGRSSTAGSRRC
jgi:membrane protease YdiL (CAAX protease family)